MKTALKSIGLGMVVCLILCGCNAERKPVQPAAAASTASLTGTHWSLEELSGKAVIADSKATLSFPEAGRIAGNGSCNRFMGPVEISGSSIKMGPLAGTKMMCEGDASAQETDYLRALEGAQRYKVWEGKLYLFVKGAEKPLRFILLSPSQDK